MSLRNSFFVGFCAFALVACGGGGGNPGSSNSGTGSTGGGGAGASSATARIAISLAGGGSSVSASGNSVVQAIVTDAAGAVVSGAVVKFAGDTDAQVKFSPSNGSALTDSKGIASIQIAPATLSSTGAGILTATTTVNTTSVSATFGYQLSPANISLGSLGIGSGTMPAYGNQIISVPVTVNGVAATNSPVQVSFTTNCGTVAPAATTTDSSGIATTTYSANAAFGCAGTAVSIIASAIGASNVGGSITISPAAASNLQFVSAIPQLIYIKGTKGSGATVAQATFKVVDSNGNGLPNRNVRIKLNNTSTGVSLNTIGSNSDVVISTDSFGNVTVPVFSGTIPSSLTLTATLLDSAGAATSISANSNVLAVASGVPVQRSLSLSLEKFALEGYNVDGAVTNVTISLADRQGNPVPPGTAVNFVAESGVFQPAVCYTPAVAAGSGSNSGVPTSNCTVTLRSQGTRTVNGRVSILAYTEGEKDFVDVNGNNVYDAGVDTFTTANDLGNVFRDDNSATTVAGVASNGQAVVVTDGIYNAGEFQVLRVGNSPCVAGQGCPGNGTWGAADVRAQTTLVFATSDARFIQATAPTTFTADYWVSDRLNNSMPTGTEISATVLQNDDCSVKSISPSRITNSLDPRLVRILLSAPTGKTCAGALVNIVAKTPGGVESTTSYKAP